MKSGVPNVVEVYDTRGSGMVLQYRYDCGGIAPTCIASHPGDPVLAVGVDHKLIILQAEKKQKLDNKVPELTKVDERDAVQVTSKEEIIKSITFCCFGEKLVTVGEDNAVIIWEYPSLEKRWHITQHLSEVTQVTGHVMGDPEIVTATRSTECFVWDVESGKRKHQLKYAGLEGVKYRYRNIRYGTGGSTFYAVVVPIAWSRDSTSHLVKYDCEDWSVIREGKVVGEPLAELAVSPDENFVATASSNGHVYVFDSYSMGLRRCISEAHGLFVTGLCFTSHTADQYQLLSISADRECKVHNPHLADPARYLKALVVLFLLLGVLYLAFTVLSAYDFLPHIDDLDQSKPSEYSPEEMHHKHSHNEL